MMVCVCFGMLDPFLEQIMILGLAFSTVIMGGVIGLKWVQMHSLDKKFVDNKVRQYKDLADEYKKEASRWRGKVGKNFQNMQIDGDYDLNSESDLGDIAKMVLPNIIGFLPPEIQNKAKGFLDNPDMINMAIELYKKHPKQIQELLGKFVKGGIKSNSSDQTQLTTKEEITNYA